jgi:DNA-binding MarR family transcriptional regulator
MSEEKIWFAAEPYDSFVVSDGGMRSFLFSMGEVAVFLAIKVYGGATRRLLNEKMNIHPRTLERAIKALSDRGIIEGR